MRRRLIPAVWLLRRGRRGCNSAVHGAFAIKGPIPPGGVLVVDDTADSKWTLTVVGALLRQAGAGAVYPLALLRRGPD